MDVNRQTRLLRHARSRRAIMVGLGASVLELCPVIARGGPPDRSGARAGERIPAGAASAILFEEDPADRNGRRSDGQTFWRLSTERRANGGAPETIVRALVGVAGRGLALDARFRRNDDVSLPATHTIELKFTLAADFAHGAIENVPGLLMKADETARGAPLKGVSVKVTDLFFMVGLSQQDRQVNMALLHERPWFDVPIVFSDHRRAILAFAKGREGERVFESAFAAWEAPG